MPLISASNPIHRVNEIIAEERVIATRLAPFYAASAALNNGEADCDALEHNPAFRAEWSKLEPLRAEFQNLAISLALAWESTPVRY